MYSSNPFATRIVKLSLIHIFFLAIMCVIRLSKLKPVFFLHFVTGTQTFFMDVAENVVHRVVA